jgi:DmsE family decaheme c-type cytochrome
VSQSTVRRSDPAARAGVPHARRVPRSSSLRILYRAVPLAGSALVLLALLLAVAPAASGAPPAGAPALAQEGETQGATCAECHDDVVSTMARSPHQALDLPEWVQHTGQAGSCSNCHGNAEQHLATDGDAPMYSFGDSTRGDSEQCLSCHQKSHPQFLRSDHAKAGLGCTDCHSVHAEREPETMVVASLRGRPSATCVECHSEVATQFSFTQGHRLEEGTIECTSCHDPHEPSARVQLAGFKQRQCAECHVDKNGPFIFEHPVSRVDGCTACHTPHGSPNRHLLSFQKVAEACYSCHAVVPGFHSRFTLETQCTNCHSQIHGSNLHPFFLQ